MLSIPEREHLEERFGPRARRALDRLLARQEAGRWCRLGGFALRLATARKRKVRLDAQPDAAFGDPLEDLAAFSAPIRAAGRRDLAEQLLAAYALASDDYESFALIDFFECLLACEGAAERPRAEARSQLAPWLAPPPEGARYLIVLTGGVASGKSTLAKDLVRRLAAPRVEADRVREAVLQPVAELAGDLAALDRAWSRRFDADTWASLLSRAEHVLASGRHCVVDSCTPRARDRALAAEAAERHGAELVLCTCVSTAARIAKRLRERDRRDGVEAGSWEQIAANLAARYEPIAEDEPGRHIFLRTEADRSDGVASLLAALGASDRPPATPGWRASGGALRGVTFDCWNTLIHEPDWHAAHARRVEALEDAARDAGAKPDREALASAFDRAWSRHMKQWREGIHSGAREIARWSLEYLGVPLAEPRVEALTERFQHASHSGRVAALEGARDTLEALAEAGFEMALVCDTGLTPGRVVRLHLQRLGLLEPLQAQLFSDEIGVPKPDARIFRAALGALGVAPARAVHVGDLRRTDVAGARALGMGSIRLRQQHDDATRLPEADFVADHHRDVLAALVPRKDAER